MSKRQYNVGADRGHHSPLLGERPPTIRMLTKRQYLRDVELANAGKKIRKVDLAPVMTFREEERRRKLGLDK